MRNPPEDFSAMATVAADADAVVGGEGWVDTVGVRGPWRNRGLGLALLRHALTEYRRRGVRKVRLGVDPESTTGAPGLYVWAGMRVANGCVVSRKELRPGVDLGRSSEPGRLPE